MGLVKGIICLRCSRLGEECRYKRDIGNALDVQGERNAKAKAAEKQKKKGAKV